MEGGLLQSALQPQGGRRPVCDQRLRWLGEKTNGEKKGRKSNGKVTAYMNVQCSALK